MWQDKDFTGICHSAHREGVWQTTQRQRHPQGRHLPWAESPLGRHLPGRHPWADTPQAETHSGQTPFLGRHDSLGKTPPGQTPTLQADPPGQTPTSRWLLQQTVRILLKCILVYIVFVDLKINFIFFLET